MDAVVPAVEAMQLCKSEDIVEVMQAGADAALAGAAATTRMKANYGRARNYGERSVEFLDSVPHHGVVYPVLCRSIKDNG